MAAHPFDYSLYLVTGRTLLPAGKDYFESLEESIQGGVTVVQVREKATETREFLSIAARTKEICHKHHIPIIINDRIDIALAIHADGVHLGQDDMPISIARKLLPQGTVIGVSVNTPEEAKKAREDGADYVGIGALWDTQSKQLTKPILGVRGVGRILEVFDRSDIKAVAIGGIKSTNALRALHGAVAPTSYRRLDGLAVISDIVASKEPLEAAKRLAHLIGSFKTLDSPPAFSFDSNPVIRLDAHYLVREAGSLLTAIRGLTPLIHQITNIVVAAQSANTTLALGASPIMANAPEEMQDLSQVSGSLLINIGTVANKQGMLLAGRWANINRKPVVFDPVAVDATHYRKTIANDLLNEWQPSVIKGNAAEIGALADSAEVQSRGVDSMGSGFVDPAGIVRNLARKERCIVVLTGETDWLSDGQVVLRSTNGHSLLGNITGSGCMVGTSVATFCAAASMSATQEREVSIARLVNGNMLIAALGGILALTIASEIAAARHDVNGAGTFLPALIDEVFALTPQKMVERARVEVLLQ